LTERYSATEFVCNYISLIQQQFQAGRLKPSCQRAWNVTCHTNANNVVVETEATRTNGKNL
jgi:hypothetical protein